MNKEQIDKIIEEIKNELTTFNIAQKNLEKFGRVDHLDDTYLSYLNGVGGNYVKFLALLTKKLQFKTIVELGNREGLSTLAMYDQLPTSSSLTTIDIIEDVRYCPAQMHTDPRVKFLLGDVCSLGILKQVPDQIDLLFSDTIHYDFQVRDEFSIYRHLLNDVALVAVDDIHTNDKGKFWDELQYEKWDLTELCHQGGGWGLFLYKRKVELPKEIRWQNAIEASVKVWERKYQETLTLYDNSPVKSFTRELKGFIKKIPFVYRLFCKLNNKFVFIKLDTRPY